MQMSFMHGILI